MLLLSAARCGLLTHHIRFPYSLLNRQNFQNALWNTYYQNPCGCGTGAQGQVAHNTGQSQPAEHSRGHGGGRGHHHHHGRTRHQRHHRREDGRSKRHADVHLHTDRLESRQGRLADRMAKRISQCPSNDTFCHVLLSKRLRYRQKYPEDADQRLSQL